MLQNLSLSCMTHTLRGWFQKKWTHDFKNRGEKGVNWLNFIMLCIMYACQNINISACLIFSSQTPYIHDARSPNDMVAKVSNQGFFQCIEWKWWLSAIKLKIIGGINGTTHLVFLNNMPLAPFIGLTNHGLIRAFYRGKIKWYEMKDKKKPKALLFLTNVAVYASPKIKTSIFFFTEFLVSYLCTLYIIY